MKNKEKIKVEFERIKKLDAAAVLRNMSVLYRQHGGSSDLEDFFQHVENDIFDDEDREIYNELLGRKPVSYDFRPSKLRRAWAVLAILSVIRP